MFQGWRAGLQNLLGRFDSCGLRHENFSLTPVRRLKVANILGHMLGEIPRTGDWRICKPSGSPLAVCGQA